jgi:hypothetical protein
VKISLGVVELPYAEGGKSTGDVAEILEKKYGILQGFADRNIEQIADFLADGVIGAIESRFAGAPESFDVFAGAMANIEDRFHEYIDREEHGIHTKSKDQPLSGARKKRQYRRVSAKTTFVDSGLYRNNFKAWVKSYV